MPRVSRWFIRAALVYFSIGLTLGALLLANKGIPFSDALARLVPAHVELLLMGWVVQLVAGVATWIFPRFGVPTAPHRSDAAGWAAFGLLNAGVCAVAIAPLCAGEAAAAIPALGRAAEVAGAVVFAASVWARVRASGLSRM